MALRLARALVAVLAAIVPRAGRRDWRDLWSAELAHYDQWLRRSGVSPVRAAGRVLARATGAVPHAFVLRLLAWRPRMLLHDFTFAWRLAMRRPGFTAVAILVLALGIGANATIFSWVESVLLRPLDGVDRQEQLVDVRGTLGSRTGLSFSYPNFLDVRDAHPDGVDDVMAFRVLGVTMRAGDEPDRAFGELVSDNFFDVLGVRAALGRTFRHDEATTPGREPVAVISDAAWRRWFGADPNVVGRAVQFNGTPFTIVGVLPADFHGSVPGLSLDVYLPVTMQTAVYPGDRLGERGNGWLECYARLSAGASLARARDGLQVVARRMASAHPDMNEGRGIEVVPISRSGAGALLMPVMSTLMGVVAVVLLIACANLAGLLLARAAGRQREVAVRLAVGASRGRVVRQLLVESALLSVAGGAGGLLVARWTSGTLPWFIPRSPFPVRFDVHLDSRVMIFTAGLTVLTTFIAGLAPALRASRPDIVTALKDAAAAAIGGTAGRLRGALVVGQVALSALLLVSAALFARSLVNARTMDVGYRTTSGLFASIDLQAGGYTGAKGPAFVRQLLARVEAVAGVRSASVATALPLDLGGGSDTDVTIEGYVPRRDEDMTVYYTRVGPHYFDTMGIDIIEGRGMSAIDVEPGTLVTVINEAMAKRYFAGRSPIGGRIHIGSKTVTVVGVAKTGKYQSLGETPRNYMYLSIYQFYRPDLVLQVRTDRAALTVLPGVTAAVHQVDPSLPLFDVRTIDEHRRLATFVPRLAGTLLGMFGLLSLVLAAVGLYGVIAYGVAQRTREIGLRIALGATRRSVVTQVLRRGIALAALGCGIGLVPAVLLARLLRSQLFGISPFDVPSFAAVVGVLFVVTLTASAMPALRAARLEPVSALRQG